MRPRSVFHRAGSSVREQESFLLPPLPLQLPSTPFIAPLSILLFLDPSLPHSPANSSRREGRPRGPNHREMETRKRCFLVPMASRIKHPGETALELAPRGSKREIQAL